MQSQSMNFERLVIPLGNTFKPVEKPINPLTFTIHPHQGMKLTDTNVQTQLHIVLQIDTKLKAEKQAKYQQPDIICPQPRHQNKFPSHSQ